MKFFSGKGQARDNKVIRIILNTNMQNSFNGLLKIANENSIDLNKLGIGEFVVFINRRMNMLKISCGGAIVQYRSDRKIDLATISKIPKFFNGREFKYNEALAEVIKESLVR